MTDAIEEREKHIHEAFDAGDLQAAARLTLEGYSTEIFNLIAARTRNLSDADEVFAMFAEDLWNGLPKFAWRCSMRTWAYTLARHATTRHGSSAHRRPGHNVPLSSPGVVSQLIEHVRHTTRVYQQTGPKDRFRALREQLDPDDQLLLMLRVDRDMSFRDLAITVSGDPDLPEDVLSREAARLRKAFERVKTELRRLAEREGLLDI
jgi:RNA polymerase sigma-70 factor (ECF subfamily)